MAGNGGSVEDKIRLVDAAFPGLEKLLAHCGLCARKCGVDRIGGEKGYCGAAREAVVYSYGPHHGEEPLLSGRKGSGTIFFSHCGMGCVYCQNYKFSQTGEGTKVTDRELGMIMLELKDMGCHNINLVTPTHFVPAIAGALRYAYSRGLDIPVVYNTGGYDSLSVIRMLKGIVDIYLVDMRYSSDEMAEKYSCVPGYVLNNRSIVREMYEQAGVLKCRGGVAERGVIIRLLILPQGISGTEETLAFISREIGKEVYLSVMSQYYPAYKAGDHMELSHGISGEDYARVIKKMDELDFHNGWVQPYGSEFDSRFAGENFSSNL
ncbi:MAG: radical SAM protein, partial [Candidatus Omnitrophota bacterium]